MCLSVCACMHVCVYMYVSLYVCLRGCACSLCLPSGAHYIAYLLGMAITPCSVSCLTMQGKTGVFLPPIHNPYSTHTTLCTSLMRSSSLPLFLCCISSIAHYGRFVNRSMCTIAAVFICAGCIPCQLGAAHTYTAQQKLLCISVVHVLY